MVGDGSCNAAQPQAEEDVEPPAVMDERGRRSAARLGPAIALSARPAPLFTPLAALFPAAAALLSVERKVTPPSC